MFEGWAQWKEKTKDKMNIFFSFPLPYRHVVQQDELKADLLIWSQTKLGQVEIWIPKQDESMRSFISSFEKDAVGWRKRVYLKHKSPMHAHNPPGTLNFTLMQAIFIHTQFQN